MFTQLAVHTHRRPRTPPRRTPVPSPAPPPASPPPPARVSERRGERGSPSRQHPPRPTPARARSVPPCPALALQPRSSAYTETRQNTGRSSRLCLYGRDRRGAWRRGSRAPCPGQTTRVYATCSSPARSLTPFFSSPHYPISLRFQPCTTLPPPSLPLFIARSLAHMQAIPSPDRCIAPLDFSRRCSPCASIAIHALSLYVCCSFKVLFPPFLVFAVHASSKHQYFAWLSPSPRPDAHVKTAVPPSLSGFATVFSIGCILKWTAFVSRSGDFSL